MILGDDMRGAFLEALGRPFLGDELFDAVPDTVFFIKDAKGRYVAVNETLVARAGRGHKRELIGLTAAEAFPGPLGQNMGAQDIAVVADGAPIHGRLELHLYANGGEGWCLTWKEPLRGRGGRIVGLSGISRDLQPQSAPRGDLAGVARILDYMHANLQAPLRLAALANRADLTEFQFDQRIRVLFGLSAGQYLTRARINLACSLLRQPNLPISRVALDSGYGDQAAFTRQFRKSVGLTPSQYRKRLWA